jgi:hypothetical protein
MRAVIGLFELEKGRIERREVLGHEFVYLARLRDRCSDRKLERLRGCRIRAQPVD